MLVSGRSTHEGDGGDGGGGGGGGFGGGGDKEVEEEMDDFADRVLILCR